MAARSLLAASPSVTLAWDPSPDPTVVGYRLYIGLASLNYPTSLDIGASTNATVENLTPDTTYYFAVTAYDSNRVESVFSGEVSYTVPSTGSVRLTLSFTPTRQVQLSGHGPAGFSYAVLASSDLTTWMSVGSVTTDASGNLLFTDNTSATDTARYYRLRQISP